MEPWSSLPQCVAQPGKLAEAVPQQAGENGSWARETQQVNKEEAADRGSKDEAGAAVGAHHLAVPGSPKAAAVERYQDVGGANKARRPPEMASTKGQGREQSTTAFLSPQRLRPQPFEEFLGGKIGELATQSWDPLALELNTFLDSGPQGGESG